jgi:hypothetical protein
MKRNVIQKFLRISEVRQKYVDEMERLAETQIAINVKVIKEFKLEDQHQYRDMIYYDFVKVDDDARIELWRSSFRSDPAEYMSTIDLSEHIIAGDVKKYEEELRASLKPKAEQRLQAKQKQAEDRRKSLEVELARLNNELQTLEGA